MTQGVSNKDLRDHPGFHLGADHALVAQRFAGQLVYLATPYSREVVDEGGAWNPTRSMMLKDAALRWASAFAAQRVTCFAPIPLAADIVVLDRLSDDALMIDPLDATFWMGWCLPALERCAAVVVPPIEGRDASVGIGQEVRHALTVAEIPVFWLAEVLP